MQDYIVKREKKRKEKNINKVKVLLKVKDKNLGKDLRNFY